MPRYNILIGCDQTYFDKWGIVLLNSIKYHSPWINLHCHIVNPTKENIYNNIDITTETRDFTSEDSKISYLQAVRFLAVNEKFNKNDCTVTLDADSICTSSFDENEFSKLFDHQYILQHHKEDRWLAGFVTFCDNGYARELADELHTESVDDWHYGRDQDVMSKLSKKYDYQVLPRKWMSIGKNKSNSYFLTLKGNQKETDKYLKRYRIYQNFMKWGL